MALVEITDNYGHAYILNTEKIVLIHVNRDRNKIETESDAKRLTVDDVNLIKILNAARGA